MANATYTISVVLPALDEGRVLRETLESTREPGVVERIVVDGGSRDDTREVARRHAEIVVPSAPGRARQMNTGARLARGDVLLFLHADTHLPRGFASAVRGAIEHGAVGGRFDVEIVGRSSLLPLISHLMNWRSRWTGIATGDQAIFVRRDTFIEMGGFTDLPLMEDIDFTRRLKPLGPTAALRQRVKTSGRRWDVDGPLRTVLRMWGFRVAFFAGVPAAILARRYRHTR